MPYYLELIFVQFAFPPEVSPITSVMGACRDAQLFQLYANHSTENM